MRLAPHIKSVKIFEMVHRSRHSLHCLGIARRESILEGMGPKVPASDLSTQVGGSLLQKHARAGHLHVWNSTYRPMPHDLRVVSLHRQVLLPSSEAFA
jgi:hypothetical protein